ncbi:DNA polymerase III subunit beta [Prochlorococcus sp. MIT 1307]|uniref:DNA polymerase III subunit beta n=1 Tax=Prochlorococcus sp. MIT 1307 TaxID=3096219 RepID=UPI002A74DFFE|nr:DNA polymerase III subunit beta [Prochlorococcus sp. MIT 1307]
MKLICSQIELNTALQLVSRAVASRPTHPVLANVLLTADEGTSRLSLTGFDLNLGIQTSFAASVEKSGAITLPARLFGEIVSKLSNESPVALIFDGDNEQVELKSKGGNYQMRGMSADEFPELPLVESGTSFKVKAQALLKSLRGTLFASSSDEAKQLLTGVHLAFDGKSLKAAATDGHRLAVLNINDALDNDSSFDEQSLNENSTFAVTLPSRSLKEVERLISGWKSDAVVSLFCDKGQVVFLASDQVVTSRTLEGIYPNYNQLIPEGFSKSIILDRRIFISALERIAVLADQHNNVIKISTEINSQEIHITADAQDVGSGSESIPAEFTGDSIKIAFNVRYLLEGLKAIDSDSINLCCNGPTTPAVLLPLDENQSFTYLVMPVQVRT